MATEQSNLMKLPDAIADVMTDVAAFRIVLVDQRDEMNRRKLGHEAEIGVDKNFSNDTQRRAETARRLEADIDYQRAVEYARDLEHKITRKEIELERLRLLFKALTIERLEEIARQFSGSPLSAAL